MLHSKTRAFIDHNIRAICEEMAYRNANGEFQSSAHVFRDAVKNFADENNLKDYTRCASIVEGMVAHHLILDSLQAEDTRWRTQASEPAPEDGTPVLVCNEYPWKQSWEQHAAPRTAMFRPFHPNAPSAQRWRDAKGSPTVFTYWRPLPRHPLHGSR